VPNPIHQRAVVDELLGALYPSGELSKDEAWLGIIQTISWYEFGYLHIFDSSALNPVRVGSIKAPRADGPWQRRAEAAEKFIASLLDVAVESLPEVVGRMWRNALWEECESPQQKANPAGNALRYFGAYALQRWGDGRLDFREEQPLRLYWPSIAVPGVKTPAADVMAVSRVGSVPVALISCKWSMRTDRVADTIRECGAVMTAAHRVQESIRFYILCHEYGSSRVEGLLNDECVTALALVNLPVMQEIGLMTPKLEQERSNGRLLTLSELIDRSAEW
jgi:hypothetical protein